MTKNTCILFFSLSLFILFLALFLPNACLCIVWLMQFYCSNNFFHWFSICFCSLLQAGESNGLFKKTISKLSTEYRLQFVWPNVRRIKGPTGPSDTNVAVDQPKKSLSMGAIRSKHPSQYQHTLLAAGLPTVHKKRTANLKEGATIFGR